MFLQLILGFVGRDSKEVTDALFKAPPVKVWAVPPLGCCFKPCTSPRRVADGDLGTINVLLRQFMVVLPTVAALEMTEMLPHRVHELLAKVEVLSLMTAMCGLFALLQATHTVLHDRRCHAKFWTIKGMFIANTAIFRAFSASVHDDIRIGANCYTSDTMAAAWASMVTVMFSVPLALLSYHAYSAEDVCDPRLASASSSDQEDEDVSDQKALCGWSL
eukprot:UN1474